MEITNNLKNLWYDESLHSYSGFLTQVKKVTETWWKCLGSFFIEHWNWIYQVTINKTKVKNSLCTAFAAGKPILSGSYIYLQYVNNNSNLSPLLLCCKTVSHLFLFICCLCLLCASLPLWACRREKTCHKDVAGFKLLHIFTYQLLSLCNTVHKLTFPQGFSVCEDWRKWTHYIIKLPRSNTATICK